MHAGRGRGRSREMGGRGGSLNRMVVDHRPRALAILGVAQEEKEELMPHFLVRLPAGWRRTETRVGSHRLSPFCGCRNSARWKTAATKTPTPS